MSNREKFEAWYLENWGHTEDEHETLFERDPDSDEEYYRLGVRMSHQAWQAATNSMRDKCAELAAENAGLNEKMNKLATWPGIEFYSSAWEFNNGDGNAALEFMCDVQTPATDAFLAEVRAHGVERLANAWYAIANETDPGISISDSSRLKYRQRADDAADFANDIRQEAAQ